MPTLADLDVAMLRPGRSVPAINRLGGGAIAMAAPGRPMRAIGAANVVYQLRQPSGRLLALRCPMAEPSALDPAMGDRYRALAADPALARLRGDAGPLVGPLAFIPDGLAFPAADFRSAAHPLVAMEWVVGPTLLAAVDRACRDDDRPYLAALADAWAGLMATLESAHFDHGDLTSDNVLVREGAGLTLVDYDGCAWPGAPRPPTGPGWAGPAPGYAHPSGALAPIGRRDAFPALVIYASLRVLAAWPALREAHGDPAERPDGVLLFGERDLRDPDGSPLFRELRGLDDAIVPPLVGLLREACRRPVAEVPELAEAVSGLEVDEAGSRAGWSAGRPAAARPAAPSAPLPSGYPTWGRREGDRREGPAEAPRPAAQAPDAGDSPVVGNEGRQRQRLMTHLNSLLLSGDEEGARRYWVDSGLAGDPEAVRELGPRMAEVARRQLLREARATAEAGDSAALLRLWREGRFDDYRPAAPLRPIVEAARRRAGTVERLRAALDAGDGEAVARLWPEVRGDSLASSLAIRVRAMLAERVGRAVAEADRRGDDEATVAALREAEASGVVVEVAARRAGRAAAERLETRRALRAAEGAGDRETLAMLALSGRLEGLGPLPPATIRAIRRALAWPHLERALEARDDAALVAAYDEEVFAGDGVLTLDQRARIDLAQRRVAWLERVRTALRGRDGTALRAALAKVPPGAERRLSRVERARIERLTARDEAVERLVTALREGPDAAIVEALGRVEAAGAPLPEALDWAAVRGVVDRMSLAETIRSAATADPPDYARLARLLPAARAAMASGGAGLGADIDFVRLEADVLRAAHLARLREALARDDDAAIAAAAWPDPFGALARLTGEQRARVERALSGPGAR